MPYLLHNCCGQLFYEVLLVFLQVTSLVLLVLREKWISVVAKITKPQPFHRNGIDQETGNMPYWHCGKKLQVLTLHVTF